MAVDIYSTLPGDGLESEEAKLYNLINEYRAQNGLPAIPASKALTTVANRHVQDVAENLDYVNSPQRDSINPHSWSDATYDPNNQSTWPNMWQAPQRLNTGYPGNGYENFAWTAASSISAEEALEIWKNSPAHNQVILNQGIWQDRQWNALGVGIYKGYAALWFGQETDPTGTPATSSTTVDPDIIIGTEGNETLTGTTGTDTIIALGGNDTVTGAAGADVLSGNAGSDYITGDGGDDIVVGGQGDDIVIGGAGNDLMVNGNKGSDQVFGGDGNDTVNGGRENDSLFGEAGDDWLSGDLGADTLLGGAGSDVYFVGGDATDICYYDDTEDFIGLAGGLSFEQLSFSQGAAGAQILNLTTNSVLAVLPGVDVSLLDAGDFISI